MKVCVIGGGPAGMMAAIKIAEKGHNVFLFEKNEKLGKKLYITGKGRCNLTNAVIGNQFLENVVNNSKFFMGAEVRFNSKDTYDFFSSLGVPLKTERGNRVFPVSDKSSDIIKALENRLKRLKVEINLNTKVENIVCDNGKICGIQVNGENVPFDSVIVATGGMSYSSTGSTGDGYKFAQNSGHRIIEPIQALVPIILKDNDLKTLEGVSLKNVVIKAKLLNKDYYISDVGEMLFTSSGVSGPLVLSLSSFINRLDLNKVMLYIDFKPGLTKDMLINRINRDIIALKSKQVSSLMSGLLPKALVPIFLKRVQIKSTEKANQLSAVNREKICDYLKNFELTPKALASFDYAIVTAGGVNVKDVSPKSMESKVVKGLYFIGEVLDLDALTGGFNLQIAFSTAVTCASNF